MTDEEAQAILEDMEKKFGQLPDPNHYPRTFDYLMKLYKQYDYKPAKPA